MESGLDVNLKQLMFVFTLPNGTRIHLFISQKYFVPVEGGTQQKKYLRGGTLVVDGDRRTTLVYPRGKGVRDAFIQSGIRAISFSAQITETNTTKENVLYHIIRSV